MTLKLSDYTELDSLDINPKVGLYFLFMGQELVYIGKSIDVYSRIYTHRNNGVDFDSAKFTEIKDDDTRDFFEIKMIWDLRPKYNLSIIDPKVYLDNKNKEEVVENSNKIEVQNVPTDHIEQYPKHKKDYSYRIELKRLLVRSENTPRVLLTLTDREAYIIRRIYGLSGIEPKTLNEIARHFKLTRERIRQIQCQAERKLRHPTRLNVLKLHGLLK